MSSVQNHREHFSQVPQISMPRSTFDRSQGVKTTFDPGLLIPLKVEEIVPGDTVEIKTNCFVRTITNIVPYMDNLYLDFFAFFVPNRLVWDNWQKFMGEQRNPGDSTDFTIPQTEVNTSLGSLSDYFGISINSNVDYASVNALPFRGYNLIWNEWFRDEDLVNSAPVPVDNGPDVQNWLPLPRMKRHDYFTSARPWPQKGPDVLIPTNNANTVPVYGSGETFQLKGALSAQRDIYLGGTGSNALVYTGANINPAVEAYFPKSTEAGHTGLQIEDIQSLMGTINELRQAEAIQVLLERDARGGTRYIEMLKSQYGVTNPDFRLQRPELIGTGTLSVTTSPVPQTSTTDSTSPQGNLAANSIASMRHGFNFNHSFTEHGYMFIMVSARADLNYQQGLIPMWSRKKRFDFYVPALANLGEQPILNKELYFIPEIVNPTWNDMVFGYKEAWSEYRYGYNHVTGNMRSNVPNNISQWHLAQNFTSGPLLNEEFIKENPPINRILAVEPDNDAFFGDFWFDWKHTRPIPVFSIPGWSRSL